MSRSAAREAVDHLWTGRWLDSSSPAPAGRRVGDPSPVTGLVTGGGSPGGQRKRGGDGCDAWASDPSRPQQAPAADDRVQAGGRTPQDGATGVNGQAGSVTNSNSVSSNRRASRSPQ